MNYNNIIRAKFLDFETPCKIIKGIYGNPVFKIQKDKEIVEIIKTTDDCICFENVEFEEKGFNVIIQCGFFIYPQTKEYDETFPDEYPVIAADIVFLIDEDFSELLKNFKKKIKEYSKHFDMSVIDDRKQFKNTKYCLLCDKIKTRSISPEKVKAIFENEMIKIFTTDDLENIIVDSPENVSEKTIRQTSVLTQGAI
jgi:hypothetical protein